MKSSPNNIKTMSRKASDNKYLHKDFHQSMNLLMCYIYNRFGKEQLIVYLQQYSRAYYKLIIQELKEGDLGVLARYFTDIYQKEEWPIRIELTDDSLVIEQDACPGISHIRSLGEKPCSYYDETYNTIYTTLCEHTPLEYSLEYFDTETGACKQIFRRKEAIK